MSFKDTQSYKELQADWRWIHSMDPEAAAAADQWVKEHPEEWKELEHTLYVFSIICILPPDSLRFIHPCGVMALAGFPCKNMIPGIPFSRKDAAAGRLIVC